MKKHYAYMVVFSYQGGFANARMLFERKIKTANDIEWLHEFVTKENPNKHGAVVLNYKYLGREDVRKYRDTK